MQGEDAFINHGTMRRYSREEKLKAIDRVLNNNESR
jgi:transposase-like protein